MKIYRRKLDINLSLDDNNVSDDLKEYILKVINDKIEGTDVYKLDAYSPRRILNMLEKVFMFQLEQAFLEKPGHQMKLGEFVMTFLTHVKHHKNDETKKGSDNTFLSDSNKLYITSKFGFDLMASKNMRMIMFLMYYVISRRTY